MQKNTEKESWKNVEKCLASEIIRGSKREAKGLWIGIICVTVLAIVAVSWLAFDNYSQTKGFLNYLSEYDFVSQDGEGYNYYNSDIGGNVSNGAENPQTEGQKQGERNSN